MPKGRCKKCKVHKSGGIDKLRENITDIGTKSEIFDLFSETSKDDDIENVWNTKSDNTCESYTCCLVKYLIIGCFWTRKKLTCREPRCQHWEANESHDTAKSNTVDRFCHLFPIDLYDDIVHREDERKEEYSHTHFEFFDKNWSDIDITYTERNGFDAKYFSKQYTEDIDTCEDDEFLFRFFWLNMVERHRKRVKNLESIDIFIKKKRISHISFIYMLFSRIQIVYKGGYFWLFNAKSIIFKLFSTYFWKTFIWSRNAICEIYNTNTVTIYARPAFLS